VAVVRAAFRIAWRDHHLGSLRAAIARRDPEAFPKSEFL
jgi:hypothetical protein